MHLHNVDVCVLCVQEGEREGEGECALFSHASSGQYSSAEDCYLSELTAYTKKQFFQVLYVCTDVCNK